MKVDLYDHISYTELLLWHNKRRGDGTLLADVEMEVSK